MNFTEEELDVIVTALGNYFEVITDAITYDQKMGFEDKNYFNNRLMVTEHLINTIDPNGRYR